MCTFTSEWNYLRHQVWNRKSYSNSHSSWWCHSNCCRNQNLMRRWELVLQMNVIFFVFSLDLLFSLWLLLLTSNTLGLWSMNSRNNHCCRWCCLCLCRPPGLCSSPPGWLHWWSSKTQCLSSSAWHSVCSQPAYLSIYNTETSDRKRVQP